MENFFVLWYEADDVILGYRISRFAAANIVFVFLRFNLNLFKKIELVGKLRAKGLKSVVRRDW